MDNKRVRDIAQKIFDFLDPWEKFDYTIQDIEENIVNDPLTTIEYLIDLLID